MENGWKGLPYKTIAEHYKTLFNEKVYKIPLTVVDNCPNRMGLKGMQTCVFCDEWGSAANSESMGMELDSQVLKYKNHIQKKYKAKKFLAYFQAYTNTFTKIDTLRNNFESVLKYSDIVGFVIGTRPDCLSPAVLKLWQEYHEKAFVGVELGVQSFYDDQLDFLKRGHTAKQSLEAIFKIAENTKVDLGIHLMFGLPNETDQQIIDTAKRVNTLPITNVKLHNLHVLKNTPLEDIYRQGGFTPIERDPYAYRVQLFLEHLSPKIAVHRLAAFASRWEELVAPSWTADKMGTHQFMIDFLRKVQSHQSRLYHPRDENEAQLLLQLRENSQRVE